MNKMIFELPAIDEILSQLAVIDSKIESLEKNKSQQWGLLTTKQAALVLQLSQRTLQNYRDDGTIPFIQWGCEIRYRSKDIQQFLDDHYAKSVNQKGGIL